MTDRSTVERTEVYARFDSLPADESVELLRTHQIGRVAWHSEDGLLVLPVVYAWHDGAIAFRTGADGMLSRLAEPTQVAFEIDEFDLDTGTGWGVLVRGMARAVGDAEQAAAWHALLPTPWAPGPRDLVIRLDPVLTTGRVIVRP